MNLKRAVLPPQDSFQMLLEMTESELFEFTCALLIFYRGLHSQHRESVFKYAGVMNIRCGTAGKTKRKCDTRVLETFESFSLIFKA